MADLTALDMAREDSILLNEYVIAIGDALRPDFGMEINCTAASEYIRNAQTCLNSIRDKVFTINREQKGADEAIQKKQMLYARGQEKIRNQALLDALERDLKPAPFSLD